LISSFNELVSATLLISASEAWVRISRWDDISALCQRCIIVGISLAVCDLLGSSGRMSRVVVSSLHYPASRVDSLS
jgi:hypothetical protein